MEWSKPFVQLRPLTMILGVLVCALSMPPEWVRKVRGGAAWFSAPLWGLAQSFAHEPTREEMLLERIHALELESFQLKQQLAEHTRPEAVEKRSLPVRTLAREAGAWHRCLWIDAGRETAAKEILKQNSPVVQGRALVGVVEYVGRRQSLVRLITDPSCCPAIQIGTMGPQDTLEQLKRRTIQLLKGGDWAPSGAQQRVQEAFQAISPPSGSSARMQGTLMGMQESGSLLLLKGRLFHQDLLSAQVPGQASAWPQAGQKIVTSGLDGIFPEGLEVGYLLGFEEEADGEPTKGFSAAPAVENFEELHWLTVLPPGSFSHEDRPSPAWLRVLESPTN